MPQSSLSRRPFMAHAAAGASAPLFVPAEPDEAVERLLHRGCREPWVL